MVMGRVESGKSELRGNLGLRYPVPKISLPAASTGSSSQEGGSGGGAELEMGGGCGAGGKRKRG